MFRDMERFMRDYDESFFGATASPMPSFTSHQDDQAFHVTAELPGFQDKDVKVDVHRGVVTVSGERATSAPEGFRSSHRERGATKFSRSLRLPDEVDEAHVTAAIKDGVLSLTLPKRPEVKPRQIPVQLG
jgi:HSP20 family protein